MVDMLAYTQGGVKMLYCLITVKINGFNFFLTMKYAQFHCLHFEQVVKISAGDCGEEEVIIRLCSSDLYYVCPRTRRKLS